MSDGRNRVAELEASCFDFIEKIDAQRAEIERLRGALRDILSRVNHETAYIDALYAVSNIARKALGEGE